MTHRYRRDVQLPGWLWFFLFLPIGLIVGLIYKRQRLPALPLRRVIQRAAPRRYTEPDSIPLDMSDMHPGAATLSSPEEATRSGNVADVNVADAEAAMVEADVEAAPPPAEAAPPPADAEPDDLKIIEGIGPSIAGLLRQHGIVTFRQLAAAPVERLVEILTTARLNRLADPATWPEQAALAARGEWEALEQLQKSLKGGRRARLN